MKQKKQPLSFIITGRVFTDKTGVGGVSVHAIHTSLEKELANVLTNEDGGFHFLFKTTEVGNTDKITFAVYDTNKKEVYRSKKPLLVNFDIQPEVIITVDAEKIHEHLANIISLKPTEGRVFSINKFKQLVNGHFNIVFYFYNCCWFIWYGR